LKNRNRVITLDLVVEEMAKINYKPILDKYINAKSAFQVVCDLGHMYNTDWDRFNAGVRCKECSKIRVKNAVTKSHQQFEKEVDEWGNGEYSVVSKYEGSSKPVDIKHKICDRMFPLIPSTLKLRQHCPYCKEKIIFERKLKSKYKGEFILISDYINSTSEVTFRHNCGFEFRRTPTSFFNQYPTCPKCNNHITGRTTDSVRTEISQLTNNEYEFEDDYNNMKTKVKIIHIACGGELYINLDKFINSGIRCGKCSIVRNSKALTKTQEQFEVEIRQWGNDEFVVLGKYVNSFVSVDVQHKLCESIFPFIPCTMRNKKYCPKCTLKINFEKKLIKRFNGEFELMSDYEDGRIKTLFKHKVCGHEFWREPTVMFNKTSSCPKCVPKSKGEDKISCYLESIDGIISEPEYRFSDCRNKKILPFDFALFQNEKLKLLIEYDGEQHFIAIDYFGGESNLKDVKKCDGIKNNYCKSKGIPLVRIPYWEYNNCEYIIENVLGFLGIIYKVKIDSDIVNKYLTNGAEWSMEGYTMIQP
jgi:hypothetical protein